MSKAQTDIRTTSYDAATAKPFGYQGTIDDVLAQIRAEDDIQPTVKARAELLNFLGVTRKPGTFSGQRDLPAGVPVVYTGYGFRRLFLIAEDDSVEYGAPEAPKQPGDGLSPFSLEYAMQRWPENFAR